MALKRMNAALINFTPAPFIKITLKLRNRYIAQSILQSIDRLKINLVFNIALTDLHYQIQHSFSSKRCITFYSQYNVVKHFWSV